MNERILELISETDEWLENNAQSDRWEREIKFAELIVRECTNFLKDTMDDHFAAEQLEEHFGVTE
jgi:hypothetical protein